MSRTIAAVTAGQSPREDIVGEMRAFLPGVGWIEHGALDGIDETELPSLAPAAGEFPIITRIRSGKAVLVGEQALRPLLEQAVGRAAAESDLVLMICSAPFAIAQSRVPVLLPDRLLEAAVTALRPSGRIVVLTPVEDQVPLQEARWRHLGLDALVLQASPYGGTDFPRLGGIARDARACLVVLDCLGYSLSMKAEVTAASGVLAVLVRSLVARVAAELLQ